MEDLPGFLFLLKKTPVSPIFFVYKRRDAFFLLAIV